LRAPTTVATKGLVNKGTVTFASATGETAELTIAGQAINWGTVSIGADSTVAVTVATIVGGTLAGTVNDDGGLVDFASALTSGDGTGPLGVPPIAACILGCDGDHSQSTHDEIKIPSRVRMSTFGSRSITLGANS
jgi:hypothetical protein